jgi:cobalt/nickel transport system permease protein
LSPDAKLVGLMLFVAAVAGTDRRALWVFAVEGALVAVAIGMARLRPVAVLRRLSVVLPFLVGAALVPFVASGERRAVPGLGGVSVSVEGLWGAWNLGAKALLGAAAASVLALSTPVTDVIGGLTRLRVPNPLVSIVAFMLRYLELLREHVTTMRTAMVSRGHDPRWIAQAGPIAAATGSLFVRSYERGERVHQAMLGRGFTGVMPPPLEHGRWLPGRRSFAWALLPGCVAWLALAVWWVR